MLKPITIAIALFTTPVAAETYCETMGRLGEVIMENRQLGTPMSTLINSINADAATRNIIMIAYDQPRFTTEDYQQRAIEDFRNDVELACYQANEGLNQ